MAATKLKIAIIEKGLTQRELSRKVGIHESIISMIATGRYAPDKNQKALISKEIGERQDELFEN